MFQEQLRDVLTLREPAHWDNWSIERQLGYNMAMEAMQAKQRLITELVKTEVIGEDQDSGVGVGPYSENNAGHDTRVQNRLRAAQRAKLGGGE